MSGTVLLILWTSLIAVDVESLDPAAWKFETEILTGLHGEYREKMKDVSKETKQRIDAATAKYRSALEEEHERLRAETSNLAQAAAQIETIGAALAGLETIGPDFPACLVGRSWVDAEQRWTMLSPKEVAVEPRKEGGADTRITAKIDVMGPTTFCCRLAGTKPYNARGSFFVFKVDRKNNLTLIYQLRTGITERHQLRQADIDVRKLKRAEKTYWKDIDKALDQYREDSEDALKEFSEDLEFAERQQAGDIDPAVIAEIQATRPRVEQLESSLTDPDGKMLERSLTKSQWINDKKQQIVWTFEVDGRRRLARYRDGGGRPTPGGWEVLDNTCVLVWLRGIFPINVNLGGKPASGRVIGVNGDRRASNHKVTLLKQ